MPAATAQRDFEPAWHRRQRRRRAAARVILRLASASALLRGHHSAQRHNVCPDAAMPGGRRGGIGYGGQASSHGSAAPQQSLQAQLDELKSLVLGNLRGAGGQRGGDESGKGGGKGRQGGGWRREPHHAGNGGARTRPGDWTCSACGAYPCFGRSATCYKCRAPRQGRGSADLAPAAGHRPTGQGTGLARATSGATYLGPIGAGGTRPLLGGRASGAARGDGHCPTHRVPGTSLAAAATAAGAQAQRDVQRSDAMDGATVNGAEAFQPVLGGRAASSAMATTTKTPTATTNSTPTKNSWAALAEEDEEAEDGAYPCDVDEGASDNDYDEQEDNGQADGGGNGEGDGGEGVPEAELRRQWLAHCAAVRSLEREGQHDAVLNAVRAQRDAAERRWKAAKQPPPLHKRLRWAEADLRSAQAKEEARRQELAAHLQQAANKTKELEGRLEVDMARTSRKRQALAALQGEGRLVECPAVERAARLAVTGIGTDIAPALAAIIEQLGERDEGLRQGLQLLSTSLGRVEGALREAAEEDLANRCTVQYDISSDANGGGSNGGNGDGGDDGGARKSRRTTEAASATVAGAQRWAKPAAGSPWRKIDTSASAVEEARALLQAGGGAAKVGSAGAPLASDTNDLATAERRQRAAAEQQLQAALQQQQQARDDPVQAALDEHQRQQRELRRQEEVRLHLEAAAKAAADRAAQEARERDELLAKMSPEQLALAAQLHEQQRAIGLHVFGTPAASQVAAMVQQAHVQGDPRAGATAGGQEDEGEITHLMEMSPEEFSRWDMERQGNM